MTKAIVTELTIVQVLLLWLCMQADSGTVGSACLRSAQERAAVSQFAEAP